MLETERTSEGQSGISARLLRFGVVGATGTAVYYALLLVFVETLGCGVMLATSIAFVAVVIQNYALHYSWTFTSTVSHAQAFAQFLTMNGVGFGINWVVMDMGVTMMQWNYMVAQALAIVAVVMWNFGVSNFLIFRR